MDTLWPKTPEMLDACVTHLCNHIPEFAGPVRMKLQTRNRGILHLERKFAFFTFEHDGLYVHWREKHEVGYLVRYLPDGTAEAVMSYEDDTYTSTLEALRLAEEDFSEEEYNELGDELITFVQKTMQGKIF